jgi:2-dehydro-3-deoxyphosphogluconate aldolase/(4S)-4-hydroxy-2-oxoglutarate aldolase
VKAVKAPLPQVKMVPVGGVCLDNISDFIKAGASAVAVGSNLVDKLLVAEKQFDKLSSLAAQFVAAVQDARSA